MHNNPLEKLRSNEHLFKSQLTWLVVIYTCLCLCMFAIRLQNLLFSWTSLVFETILTSHVVGAYKYICQLVRNWTSINMFSFFNWIFILTYLYTNWMIIMYFWNVPTSHFGSTISKKWTVTYVLSELFIWCILDYNWMFMWYTGVSFLWRTSAVELLAKKYILCFNHLFGHWFINNENNS